MGQSVSQQLGSGALGYGIDPDFLRSQIIQQRDKQYAAIANPQQQLAARLGGLLGGGISNLSQDRGFFDINDPLLNKVTKISNIYNQVASQIDPAANPEQFFTSLQKAYADEGLGQQALMAAQEAQKAKTTGMDVQIKEADLFNKSPEVLLNRIEKASSLGTPEGDAEAMRLARINQRLSENRELDVRAKEADIRSKEADSYYKKALGTREELMEVPMYDEFGKRVGTEIYNKKSKQVEYRTTTNLSAPADTKKPDSKETKERPPIENRDPNVNRQASPAAAPAATPAASTAEVNMGAPNMAAYNQNTGVYSLQGDPIIKMISDYAAQNKTLLETNPEFRQSINDAFMKRKQELQGMLGRGVRME